MDPVTVKPSTPSPATVPTNPAPQPAPTPLPSEPTVPPQPPNPQVKQLPGGGKYKKLFIVLLIVLLAAGAAAAYYFTKEDTAENKTPAVVKNDIPELKVGVEGPFNTFYPEAEVIFSALETSPQVFEGLVAYNNETSVVPSLATSWTNPDDNTWVFKLKPGVKFHSGKAMTAADVKYGIEASEGHPYGDTFGGTIASVTAVDDLTVEIKTSEPDPILLNKLVHLRVLDADVAGGGPAAGTGPFTLKTGTTPSEDKLELVAFDDYHGGRPTVRALTYLAYEDSDEAAVGLKDGTIDVSVVTNKAAADELAASGFSSLSYDSLTVYMLGLNSTNTASPVSKLKVRQAINLALDRAEVIKARSADGQARYQFQSADIPGYNKDLKDVERNVTEAKKLLTEAGYPNGFTLKFTYGAHSVDGAAAAMKTALAEAGITFEATFQEDTDKYIEDVFGGKLESWWLGSSSDLLDGSDVISNDFIDQPFYDDKNITTLFNTVNTTLDTADRLKALQDISTVIYDEVAWVPLYEGQFTLAYKSNIKFEREIAGANYGIYWWQAYQ